MNGKQAEKMRLLTEQVQKQAELIRDLDSKNIMQSVDIQDYVAAMMGVIDGESPCLWCEEKRLGDCTEWENMTNGCHGWWLRLRPDHPLAQQMEQQKQREASASDSESVFPAGETSGERAENAECEISPL